MGQITIEKLNTLTGRVEKVLREYPITRDSDIELWSKVCELFYPPFERPIYNYRDFASVLRSLPSQSDIARARRKVIQNNKYEKYLPNSWFVAAARNINERTYEAYARQNDIPLNDSELTAKLQRDSAHEDNLPSHISKEERLRLEI